MLPRLVPEILSKCTFCDGAGAAGAAVGVGDSRSLVFIFIYHISSNLFVKETLWSGSSNEAGGQGRGQGRQMSAIISVGRCSRVQQSAIMGPILGGQKGKKESWRCVDPRTGQGPQMSP